MSKSVAIALALFLAVAAWIGSGFLGDKPQEALERAESGPSEAPTKLASVQVQRLAVSSVDRILDLMGDRSKSGGERFGPNQGRDR